MATPVRSCRVCHKRASQNELKRWTLISGQLVADTDKKQSGRGFYTDSAKCEELLAQVIKKKGK